MIARTSVLGAAFALGLAGCGWYTNFPAAIDVVSVEPSTVAVEYLHSKPDGPIKGITAKYTNPTITLAGKPGSIGATFRTMNIVYYATGQGVAGGVIPDINGGKALVVKSLVRVDSSAMREDYEKGFQEMDPAEFPKKRLIIGQAKFVAPVVSNDVLALAAPGASTRPTMIWAHIVLEGDDDARWPYTKEVMVPITFADTVQ
ncbi:MAG: hypothetical protein FJZ01_25510 [Candidatus Sericytochromatia bacterium]|nr:hypothetical protein [Candidatus Tanganyikabacteria bacterium]